MATIESVREEMFKKKEDSSYQGAIDGPGSEKGAPGVLWRD